MYQEKIFDIEDMFSSYRDRESNVQNYMSGCLLFVVEINFLKIIYYKSVI